SPMRPATSEGTSIVTLSEETSKIGSSTATGSPPCFSQRGIVPVSTLSPSCGIVTSIIALGRLLLARVVGDRGRIALDPAHLRERVEHHREVFVRVAHPALRAQNFLRRGRRRHRHRELAAAIER